MTQEEFVEAGISEKKIIDSWFSTTNVIIIKGWNLKMIKIIIKKKEEQLRRRRRAKNKKDENNNQTNNRNTVNNKKKDVVASL